MTVPADTCDTSAARTARVVLITGAVHTGAAQACAAEAARAVAPQAADAAPAGDAPSCAPTADGAPMGAPRAGLQQADTASHAARPGGAPTAAAVGRALAVGFARRGWDVALAAAAGDEARAAAALAAEVEALGRRAAVLVADLSAETDVARLVAECGAALGRPACVVAQPAPVADNARDVGYASLACAMARGVAAPLVLARTLADATPDAARDDERERAVVIHLLDETLFHPAPERLSHSLAQAALHRATTAQALALAPKVRVVGLVRGRAPRADDIADAACYLADAPGVTGATLTVDGGEHLAPPADERN
ncbi:putative oxidoreductase [Burkholderia thailandensis 34]|uniref:SDR family oxidoreductase n=1 Tax=Burkholderia thailandensis TaxID=57975 RepID=UPI0005D75671|nr:SDR family oxidoreductase [Burkholderia thailandensis]AJY27926.1 putative oxidoreductase [Burkholderia thailandensis 34]AOJ57992.1 short-chain dehydrogenase [Burkholderia thailandensis]KXF61124.1 short-chain dehydrogenase [Burkholderia thailandensis]PNE74808.1 short-chain dehydrogenase [Burkholderia thailandensis]